MHELPPRRRRTCAGCDHRRLCWDVTIRRTALTIPLCDECLIEVAAREREVAAT